MKVARCVCVVLVLMLSASCVTEDTYNAQVNKYETLLGEHNKTKADLDAARARVAELEKQLEGMGVKLDAVGTEKADILAALEEFKQRAAVLERIKARFEKLRKKLEKLTQLGLDVRIHRNRMVISLPGDVLFDSGKDELKEKGEAILEQVATVIRTDKALETRYYQVAGHTDHVKLGGQAKRDFKDNWGLSLMRARRVLLFMIQPRRGKKKGGGLSQRRWSAAGYGQTDPIANNRNPAGRQKNRRVELTLLPNVEEMLDLKSLLPKTDKAEKPKKVEKPKKKDS